MASLVKQSSGIYYANFYDADRSPKYKRFSLETKRKREARRKLTQLEDDYEKGLFDPWWGDDPETYRGDEQKLGSTAPPTLNEALDQFLEAKKRQNRAADTIRTYRTYCGCLIARVDAQKPVSRLTPQQVADYIHDDSVTNTTSRTRFRHVRAWLRWCDRQGYVREPATERVNPPQESEKVPKAVREEDLRQIIDTIRRDYAEKLNSGHATQGQIVWIIPLFQFALYTGMRSSEIARLRWEHIDHQQKLIYIYEQKNGKQQTIPLNRKAESVLETIDEGDPHTFVFNSPNGDPHERSIDCFKLNVSRKFTRYRKLAGIERPLSFHGLRHGFCSILAEAGKSAPIIKDAARHSDISTSMRYVHLANEQLKAELDDVFAEEPKS